MISDGDNACLLFVSASLSVPAYEATVADLFVF